MHKILTSPNIAPKIIIAIVAIAALALTVVGVATAKVAQNQYYTNTAPNTQAPNNSVWGWIGNYTGYNTAQGQYLAPPSRSKRNCSCTLPRRLRQWIRKWVWFMLGMAVNKPTHILPLCYFPLFYKKNSYSRFFPIACCINFTGTGNN